MRSVVTGASGFVGRALMARLPEAHAVSLSGGDWIDACAAAPLRDAVVYHLGARVHGTRPATEAEYLFDNAEKTRGLAERAAQAGARAFVFLSTVKVNGEETGDRAFSPDDEPAPHDAYARSKLAAEVSLLAIAARTGLRVAIVRTPLVYGAAAKGNLAALLRLADSPWPLPFAALHRPRSFLHVDDLCGALLACAEQEQASGVYLVAHAQPVDTAGLVTHLRRELGRPRRLFAVSPAAFEAAAALTGQRERARRLARSLVVDASRARQQLGWAASRGIDECVRDMVAAYRGRSA